MDAIQFQAANVLCWMTMSIKFSASKYWFHGDKEPFG